MSAEKIEAWIANLGESYEELLAKSLVPDEDFIELFPDIEELYLEPEKGIAMGFESATERFSTLFVTLRESMPGIPIYEGELPFLYYYNMNQAGVHSLLGKPWESLGPILMPQPMGQTGGWDSYFLDSEKYPNIKVQFQYLESMDVKVIVFTLIEKVVV